MTDRIAAASRIGVSGGLILGAGFGATIAALFGAALAPTIAYGTGAGLVVGALGGLLAEANRGQEYVTTRVVGGTLVIGGLVGSFVGIIGAWGSDAPVLNGVGVGLLGGAFHGLLLGGVLAQMSVDETAQDDAPDA